MEDSDARLELKVEHAIAGGRCLAHREGKAMLVAGALPGERVRARLTRDEKRHAEAEVEEVLEAHPLRRAAPCPHAAECGGCDYQHAPRELQLELKRSIVLDAFRRIGRLDVADTLLGPEAIVPEFGARNRIRLAFSPTGPPGLMRRASHDVVPIDDCLLMAPLFGKVVLPWLKLAPPWHRAGVRLDGEGHAFVLFETGTPGSGLDRRRLGRMTKSAERPEVIAGLLADGVPLAGRRELRYTVGGFDLRADVTAFFQTSTAGAEALLTAVAAALGETRGGTLLDLYAGVGLFAVAFGKDYERVYAADADRHAVRSLKKNLRLNRVRAEARAETAEQTLQAVPAAQDEALRAVPAPAEETVIVDPPRSGLERDVRRLLCERRPARIVSVSCDPATAARDVAAFRDAGYRLERLEALDLFPVTAHVETVALLVR
jgi:tRNA/tmRNA/rRNA uracil-C5-methylase (TrmA/RlmC/RlmD family)